MKNVKKPSAKIIAIENETFDGGGIGLIVFAATAIWLLVFYSNIFR